MTGRIRGWGARGRFPFEGRSLVVASWMGVLRAIPLMLGLALVSGCEAEDPFDTPTARYVSPTYGFSVAYPDTMDLREDTPERIMIGFSAGDGFDPHVEIVVESDTADSFESLVERKARDSCLAEGGGIFVRCTNVQRNGRLRAKSRDRGDVLYMTVEIAESTDGPAVESMARGPYIGFRLESEADTSRVLFVRAPLTRQLRETDVDLVTNVARSLEIED